MEDLLKIDCSLAANTFTEFLRDNFKREGFGKGVIGLSGGLDSSVSAYLSVRALGCENVIGVLMPYKTSAADSLDDAEKIVKILGIKHYKIDITPMVDAFFENFPDAGRIRRGNKMARERMCVLYDISQSEKALVVGTSNKTEILLGYGTLHGDVASAINPLSDLYKTQVRMLAEFLNVPEEIRKKPPSAGLWENQTDEDELGFTYAEVDKLLYLMIDKEYKEEQLMECGFSKDFIDRVVGTIKNNEFKRRGTITARF